MSDPFDWDTFHQTVHGINTYLCTLDPALTPILSTVTVNWKELLKQPYVALIGAIVGQKIRFTQACAIRSKIYSKLGTKFTCTYFCQLTSDDLAKCGLSLPIIEILYRVNRELMASETDVTVETLNNLISVSGIGPWTIQTTLLSSGLDWDMFPPCDVFLQKKIQKMYGLSKKPTFKEMEEISQRWRPYRGIVCWYLWRWF